MSELAVLSKRNVCSRDDAVYVSEPFALIGIGLLMVSGSGAGGRLSSDVKDVFQE